MNQNQSFKKALIYIIPGISILWSLYLIHLAGPFYLTRIDPEFPYLLNGLNCARLDFSRIGHIDHPGTPFQLLTGLFISITYWISGHGTMVEHVISYPEFYLSWSSFYLSVIIAIILLWFGKNIHANKGSLVELLILQSAVFLSIVLIDLPSRYIPDRFLEILSLVFIGLCYKYFYTQNYSSKKFAIHAGIVMGIGFVTKFNFLPLLIIPFIIVSTKKERFIYIIAFVITAVVMFLPVIKEFAYFKGFITSIITHDGLYGGGSEQVFNLHVFWNNTTQIFKENIPFSLSLFFSVVLIVFLSFKPIHRNKYKKEFLFLISFVAATLIAVLMIAKHYKNYYAIPVVSLTAFVFLITYLMSRSLIKIRSISYVFGLLLIAMIIIPASKLYPGYKSKAKQNSKKFLISNYIKNNISPSDYFLIEPTWMSGPMETNGLIYGMSYVAFRHYYYNEIERLYPNVITWEGKNKPLRYFRMLDADNEAILKSGKKIYILSTPGRNANVLISYIDSCFKQIDSRYILDTVFQNSNANEYIISIQQNEDWTIKTNARIGFEKVKGDLLCSNDEKYNINGSFERSEKRPSNGMFTLKVSPDKQSPEFIFAEAFMGDFLEITIKRIRNNSEIKGNLHLYYSIPDSSNTAITTGEFISHISSYYEILRLTAEVPKLPENAILKCCYYNHGNSEEFVDDFTLKLFSKN